jgi:hypothetical protein
MQVNWFSPQCMAAGGRCHHMWACTMWTGTVVMNTLWFLHPVQVCRTTKVANRKRHQQLLASASPHGVLLPQRAGSRTGTRRSARPAPTRPRPRHARAPPPSQVAGSPACHTTWCGGCVEAQAHMKQVRQQHASVIDGRQQSGRKVLARKVNTIPPPPS